MNQSKETHWFRLWGAGIAAIVVVAAGAVSGSCIFGTTTTLCEAYNLRCRAGQECATDQAVCINIGGCGNHHTDQGEACDDGNTTDGDGCNANCTSDEICGNGIVDENAAAREFCDDGNTRDRDGCSSDCHREEEVCGNLIVDQEIGEICDDGNVMSSDGCRADCKSNEACGNNVIDAHLGEECEFADSPFPRSFPDTSDCDNDCTFPICGDGHLNPAYMVTDVVPPYPEQCDSGVMGTRTDSQNCDSDCTFVRCGDNHRNMVTEQCDDGDTDTGDGKVNSNIMPDACRTDCRAAFCGDRVMDTGEMCDDNNNDNADFCPNGINGTCKPAVCGDGFKRTQGPNPEGCDDGNGDNSDDCPDGSLGTCNQAVCGDGFRRTQGANPEQCDKGSANSDTVKDACRTNCLTAHCGDNVKDTNEQCDPPMTGICMGAGAICNADCQCI